MGKARSITLIAIVAAVLVADQATKYLAVSHLTTAFEGRHGLVDRLNAFFTLKNLDNEPFDPAARDFRRPAHVVVEDYWAHRYVENPGAAWGLLASLDPRYRVPFFHLVSLVAIALLALYCRRVAPVQPRLGVALALIMGGALGNYVDRLARNYVIDFIDWHWRNQPGLHWPTFNVADAAISVGVLLLLSDGLLSRRRGAVDASTPAEEAASTASLASAADAPRALDRG